jgi:hypothetical protein
MGSKVQGSKVHMLSPPKFEDIGALHLARDLTRDVNGRKVTLNPEPVNAYI